MTAASSSRQDPPTAAAKKLRDIAADGFKALLGTKRKAPVEGTAPAKKPRASRRAPAT